MSTKFILNNGVHLPSLGFGTYRLQDRQSLFSLLKAAVQTGYRLIDTAPGYHNEDIIGDFLQDLPKLGLSRQDVFLTSKLSPADQGKEKCRSAALATLKRLRVEQLDLFIIHWPGVRGMQNDDPKQAELRKESWLEMENMYSEGKFKAIGVSNYTVRHLKELLGYCKVAPAVLQVEFHPHLVQLDLLKFCIENNIHLQAYSTFGAADGVKMVLEEPVLNSIGSKYQKTPAQVILRWAIQLGISVIPKTSVLERVEDNSKVFDFELTREDINSINRLDQRKHYCWNPDAVA